MQILKPNNTAKQKMPVGCLLISIILMCAVFYGAFSLTTSIRNENANYPMRNLTNQISKLSSNEPKIRAEAALQIGSYGSTALQAVPLLIKNLDDETPLEWAKQYSGPLGATVGTGKTTSPGEEARKALISITGQNFGKDKEKWLAWWRQKNQRK